MSKLTDIQDVKLEFLSKIRSFISDEYTNEKDMNKNVEEYKEHLDNLIEQEVESVLLKKKFYQCRFQNLQLEETLKHLRNGNQVFNESQRYDIIVKALK